MKTVLLIDPSNDWARMMRDRLDVAVRLLWVPSADAAKDVYLSSPRVDAVVIGWLEGAATTHFLDWLHRQEFVGPILAATPAPSTNAILVAAGCTRHVQRKEDAPAVISQLVANFARL